MAGYKGLPLSFMTVGVPTTKSVSDRNRASSMDVADPQPPRRRSMKVLHTARAISTGERTGHGATDDRVLDVVRGDATA